MSFALDHVFVCVEDAPEAERILTDFGMQLGRSAIFVRRCLWCCGGDE